MAEKLTADLFAADGSSGERGLVYLTLAPVNDPPVVAANTTLVVDEGRTATISNAHLPAIDGKAQNHGGEFSFQTDNPGHLFSQGVLIGLV